MNTQLQPAIIAPSIEVSDLFSDLLNRDYKPQTIALPAAVEPGRRFVKVAEITGEVEVEREIDFGYTVCGICYKRGCSCNPRVAIQYKERISYPVEMVTATVISLQ